MLRILCRLSLGFLLAATAAFATEPPAGIVRGPSMEGVTEYDFANGLKALLIPDLSVDTITVNVTYLVGSLDEGYGETGMAHLLEHMLFRGTPRHPDIKAEFERRGARWNGTTSYDRTNYFETVPASRENLEWALDLESDRMLHSYVSRKDLDSEMTVVRNEFELGENSPAAVLRQRVAATAYLWHNYGHAVIGARSDIENVPIERLQAFYHRYYQPDNAVVLISGKFDETTALALLAKYFGAIPKPQRALPRTYTVEPTQDGEREVVLRRVGDVQIVSALYHVPPGSHPDFAAVDVLASVLAHVPSGRLHKALVETGLASSVSGDAEQQRDAGFAYFSATLDRNMPIEPARRALIATIEGLAARPVTEDEVARARTRLVNEIELALADSRRLTAILSEYAAVGDWRLLFWYRDRLKQVTAGDVQRVALAYFKPSNRTLGLFVPTAQPDRAEIPPAPDLAALLKDYRGAGEVAAGEAFDPTPAAIEARVIRSSLPVGMKLALLPKKTRGRKVVVQLALHWGDDQSKRGRASACGIASAMLIRGTRRHTRGELRDEFDRLKAQVSVGTEGASIETVRENLPAVLALVAEVLREPAFPESEFEQLRRSVLTGIDAERNDPGALSAIALARHLNPWPPDHWLYQPTLDERAERLKALTLDDVKKCYRDFVGASNSEMAVVGDFDPEEIVRLAAQLFGDWKSPRPYQRIHRFYRDIAPVNRAIETPDKANAVYRAGLLIPMRDDDPDYPAMLLANYLLGGSSDSRLVRRVREQEGLSYSVGSWFYADSFDRRAVFGVSAIYAPQNLQRVQAAIGEELLRAVAQGFTDAEVAAGKKGLLEARQLARTRDSALASELASYLELGRTLAWDGELEKKIARLSAAQVNRALARYLDPEKLSVVKAGDFTAAARSATPSQPRRESGAMTR